MDRTGSTGTEASAVEARLASEVADVESAIALVRSRVATTITLTGLRFAQTLANSLAGAAASEGIRLEATFWPEDDLGDLHISLIADPDGNGPEVAKHG
jgi:hypothetical protein